jgi:hypothetical protein
MCRWLNRGELLNEEELKEIAERFTISQHAKDRIIERYNNIDIKKAILHPVIAYYNTDRSVNIAINGFEYIVISPYTYKVITLKERSLNSIDIFTKRELAVAGKARKIYKKYTN